MGAPEGDEKEGVEGGQGVHCYDFLPAATSDGAILLTAHSFWVPIPTPPHPFSLMLVTHSMVPLQLSTPGK